MIIKPRVKDYLCLTAHPEGCKKNVEDQIAYVKAQGEIPGDAKKVLVIGCSTGYGLASRIVAAFGCHADTLGIMFERPSNGRKTASPGWYNTASFEQFANEEGIYAKTINGDAFSKEIKNLTIETIKKDLGKVDLVVYRRGSRGYSQSYGWRRLEVMDAGIKRCRCVIRRCKYCRIFLYRI